MAFWGRCRFCVANATDESNARARPRSRGTFSCTAKRKYPKRRPPYYITLRVPCASHDFRRSQNSLRSNNCSLKPEIAAMLGDVEGASMRTLPVVTAEKDYFHIFRV